MTPSKVEANLLAVRCLEVRGIRFRTLTEFLRSEGNSKDVEASPVHLSGIPSAKEALAAVDKDGGVAVDEGKDSGRGGCVQGDKDGDIPDPLYRLLRGP